VGAVLAFQAFAALGLDLQKIDGTLASRDCDAILLRRQDGARCVLRVSVIRRSSFITTVRWILSLLPSGKVSATARDKSADLVVNVQGGASINMAVSRLTMAA
jgi:hypothetical protein